MLWKDRGALRPFGSVVVAAAGSASRMGGIDKQFAELMEIPVIVRSIRAFERSKLVDEIVVVTRPDQIPELGRMLDEFEVDKVKTILAGGQTRQQSVFAGVDACSERCGLVAIHDGARPLVDTQDIDRCIQDAAQYGAALLCAPVKDTIKRAAPDGTITATVDRQSLFAAQTPQIFRFELYRRARTAAERAGRDFTDDCQLFEHAGIPVHLTVGSDRNLKITTPYDLVVAQALLELEEEQ